MIQSLIQLDSMQSCPPRMRQYWSEQSSRYEFGVITSSFLNLVFCSFRIDSRHFLSIVDGGRVV
jgi:hypothetical protein